MIKIINSSIKKARAHSGFIRYFANTTWMFAEQMIRMLAGFAVGIWVARYLGPSQFGVFSYVIAFAALFGSFSKLGLDSIVVRDMVLHPEKANEYMGTAFWLKMAGAFLMLGMIFVALSFTSNDHQTKLYVIVIASGAIFQSFEVVDFYFQSKVMSKLVSICKTIQLLISSFIKLYLIHIEASLLFFVIVSLIDQMTLAISLYAAYRSHHSESFVQKFNINTAISFLKAGFPLIISGIAITIYIRIDQLMVMEMLGSYEAGIYSSAIRLSEMWYFVPMVISQSLFPSIVNGSTTNVALYKERFRNLYRLLIAIAIFIAIVMSIFNEWIVVLLYGDAYKSAAMVLLIHTWAGVFVAMGVVGSKWLIINNLQHLVMYREVSGALINIVLSIKFIPIFGISGAAYSTIIAILASSYLFDYFDKRTRPMFWQKTEALLFVKPFIQKAF